MKQAHQQRGVHQKRGFTLLELLVAIAVFAVMSVMAYGGLSNIISSSTHSREALQQVQNIQRAMFTLNRDLSQIVERNIRDEFGNTQPWFSAGNSPDNLVEFTRGGRRNPAKLLRSHLLRVAYRFEDDKLSRLFWPHLDRAQNAEAYETVLLENVRNAEFRYLDADGEWHQQWPPLNTADTADAEVIDMIAIEFRLEVDGWGEIIRLFRTRA